MRLYFAQIFPAIALIAFVVVLFTQFGNKGTTVSSLKSSLGNVGGNRYTGPSKGNILEVMAKNEKLWVKTVIQRHEMRDQHPDMGMFPTVDTPDYSGPPISIWDLIPASYNCPFESECIGQMGGGGKCVCGLSKYEKDERPCTIYSFGVEDESGFEEEMLERTQCQIWGYDSSVDQFGSAVQDKYKDRTVFTKAGIAGNSDPASEPPRYNIQDIMDRNKHEYVDILKLGIDFEDFDPFSSLLDHIAVNRTQFPIGQVLIEIHLVKDRLNMDQFMGWWERMEKVGLRPVWTELNSLASTAQPEDGMPRFAKYSLVNTKDKMSKLWR